MAGKRITGRQRHLGRDALGLPLTVPVTAAGVSYTAAGVTLLRRRHLAGRAGVTCPSRRPATCPWGGGGGAWVCCRNHFLGGGTRLPTAVPGVRDSSCTSLSFGS